MRSEGWKSQLSEERGEAALPWGWSHSPLGNGDRWHMKDTPAVALMVNPCDVTGLVSKQEDKVGQLWSLSFWSIWEKPRWPQYNILGSDSQVDLPQGHAIKKGRESRSWEACFNVLFSVCLGWLLLGLKDVSKKEDKARAYFSINSKKQCC